MGLAGEVGDALKHALEGHLLSSVRAGVAGGASSLVLLLVVGQGG